MNVITMPDDVLEKLREQAYIAACELVGPNAADFEATEARILSQMEEAWFLDFYMERDAMNHPPHPDDEPQKPIQPVSVDDLEVL